MNTNLDLEKARSTVDKIFALRELQTDSYAYRRDSLISFVVFKQKYTRIRRELFSALLTLGVKRNFPNLTKLTLELTDDGVKIKT